MLECSGIDFAVTLKSIAQSTAVFGKGGRIEDDKVVFVFYVFEKLEGISSKGLMTLLSLFIEVQCHIAVDQFDSLGTAVYRMYQSGSTTQGVAGKTTGIAEHVEHVLSIGIVFK